MIHNQAIVHPEANLAANVKVGPWSIIGPNVTIGADSVIDSHCVIKGPTVIGEGNHFFAHCSIGEDSQDIKFKGEDSSLIIGDNNVFREFVTIHRGTAAGGGLTQIGHSNLCMNYSHIAHDCQLGNHIIMSNNATLAGHVIVGDHATFGGFSAVHQFVRIGCYAFVSAKCAAYMDVIPCVLLAGERGRPKGLNKVGLKRKGFTHSDIRAITDAYKIICRSNYSKAQTIENLTLLVDQCEMIQTIIDFIHMSTRGIAREVREAHCAEA